MFTSLSIHQFSTNLASTFWILRQIVNKSVWKFSDLHDINYSFHREYPCLLHKLFFSFIIVIAFFHLCYANREVESLIIFCPLILFIVYS